MNKQNTLPAYLMILAALSFWAGWFLMPDPGTTDTEHILDIVRASRKAVLCSVILQIISSVLFMVSLFLLLCRNIVANRMIISGVVLFGIGAMGMCADAFFHLLAWFMTQRDVNIQADVVKVMELMQTKGLYFLVPLMIPFFIGSLLLSIELYKQKAVSRKPMVILSSSLLVGIAAIFLANILFGATSPVLSLTILGVFTAGLVVLGWELLPAFRKAPHRAVELLEVYW